MAPTICTEKEARVRNSIRDSRRKIQHSTNSSSSSVISYVGKVTHRRSISLRNAASRRISKSPESESTATQSTQDDSDQEVPHGGSRGRDKMVIRRGIEDSDSVANDGFENDAYSIDTDVGHSRAVVAVNRRRPSHMTDAECDSSTPYVFQNDRDRDFLHGFCTRCSSNSGVQRDDGSPINRIESRCRCFYETNGVIVRINQHIIADDASTRSSFSTASSWDDDNSNSSNSYGHHPSSKNFRQSSNTKGLLDIAVKTIKLIQRNQLLQRKLSQLQFETREFIESVLANPENQALREKIHNSKQVEMETA